MEDDNPNASLVEPLIPEEEPEDNPDEEFEENSEAERPKTESEKSFLRRWVNKSQFQHWDKAFPIAVRDLSVSKDSSSRREGSDGPQRAPTFATAVIGFWLADKLRLGGKRPDIQDDDDILAEKNAEESGYVVKDINAVLIPGESTLIIGPSSSGKSTLMRYIADSIEGKPEKNKVGEVLVGGVDPTTKENKGKFRRTTALAEQGDLTLTPILTVEETLTFTTSIAETNTPEFTKESVDAALRLAGISHVAGTVVGDADIRGVSGGQKRRVKVLEKMVGDDIQAVFLDEITNGLDAATALSICELIKASVESTGATAMTCLLQPSVDAYNTFHRIIVLTIDGQMAYSGKREGAVPHFESLGLTKPHDMDEPEFLLRCAYSPSQFYLSETGSFPSGIVTPKGLVKMFVGSDAGKALKEEVDDAATIKQPEKIANLKVKPGFARSYWQQLKILLGRGWKLVMRSPNTFGRIFMAVFFGIFIGTLFLNTKSDSEGTTQRAGYAFTLVFLLFLLAAGIPQEELYKDRVTFYCHRQANFYRTGAYYLANILTGTPLFLLESIIFSVSSFFLVGMTSYGGGGYFYFFLICFLMVMNGGSMARLLSYTLPTEAVAASLGPAVLIVFSATACFTPTYPNIPGALRWLGWVSPPAYAFEAIMINEVHTRCVETCAPGNPCVCVPGNDWLQMTYSLPRNSYEDLPSALNTPAKMLAFDAGMIAVFTLVFELLGVYFLHKSQDWYGPKTKRFQVSAGMSLITPPSLDRKEVRESQIERSEIPDAPHVQLTCDKIIYEVDVEIKPEEEKEEEGQTENEEESGETPEAPTPASLEVIDEDEDAHPMTATEYGQTGRGATTEMLLKMRLGEASVRSSKSLTRKDVAPRDSSGGTYIAELPPSEPSRLRLLSGITASFEPGTTTALMGSSGAGKTTLLDVLAGYKTGGHIIGDIKINGLPKTDKTWRSIAGYCEQTDIHNTAITVRESLIFSARMRLRPFSLPDEKKIAFCEEIMQILELEEFAEMLVGNETTGEGLPKHARKRLTVAVELAGNPSILFADEPTSGLDSLSADLVVKSMSRAAKQKGLTVVCTIHQPSREVFLAFDNLLLLRKGGQVTYNGPIANISDYMVLASGKDEYEMPEGVNPADHALDIFCGPGGEKEDWAQLYKSSDMARDLVAVMDSLQPSEVQVDEEEKAAFYELHHVTYRQMVAHFRTPAYMSVRLAWTLFASTILALIFMNQPETLIGAQNTIGGLFFYVLIPTVPMLTTAVPLVAERAVMYRESTSGTYSKLVYGLAVQLAELPFNLFMAIVSFVLYYFIAGLDSDGQRIVYCLLMTMASYWLLPVFGQLMAFVTPNVGAAIALGSLLVTIYNLTMGFLQLPTDIPKYYIWIYWINPFRYLLQGVAVNEIGGGKVYTYEVMNTTISGDAFLHEQFDWSYSERWWYCYGVVLIFALAVSIGTIFSARISWMKR